MRICVQISGQARNFKSSLLSLEKCFSPFETTYIFSTWRRRGVKRSGSFGTWGLYRLFSTNVARSLPPYFLHDQLFSKIPELHAKVLSLEDGLQDITAEQINAVLPSCVVDIEDDAYLQSVPGKYPGNQYRMHYKIWRSNILRQQVELSQRKPFDVILRTRPDLVVWDLIIPDEIINSHNCLSAYVWNQSASGVDDCICLSSPRVADIYSNKSNILDTYFLRPQSEYDDGHRILKMKLNAEGVLIKDINAKMRFESDKLTDEVVIEALHQSQRNCSDVDLRKQIHSIELVVRAKAAYDKGVYTDCVDLASRARTLDENAFAPYFELARCAAQQDNTTVAVQHLNSSMERVTNDCHPQYIRELLESLI